MKVKFDLKESLVIIIKGVQFLLHVDSEFTSSINRIIQIKFCVNFVEEIICRSEVRKLQKGIYNFQL